MVLYLLFPALLLGVVESQTGNLTDEELSKPGGKLGHLGNQTFRISKNDTAMKPATSNQTVITEDDESFQDQEHNYPHMHCLEEELVVHSHNTCGAQFHEDMLTISVENWCDLDYVIRPYNDMTICMETLSLIVGCYYPNPNVQDFFLHIHSQYFQNCSEEELLLSDAPHGVVVILTLIPVSLIPILVFLVVWKSKVRE
ncbi:receptor activity-modifying protein 3 [Centroberyx affinis]|uniref:receptor activity-modifying protein 3 n=1 Tax=Centroberyx affinis TaxID=166261 RepID=UPI003A5C15FE